MKSIIAAKRDLLTSVQGSNIWSGQQVQSYNSQAIVSVVVVVPLRRPSADMFDHRPGER